jgi:hypothetical protein
MSESTENAADTELDAEGRGMLNQAEIDSLMRFDEPARSGMERLIRSGSHPFHQPAQFHQRQCGSHHRIHHLRAAWRLSGEHAGADHAGSVPGR